MEKQQLIRNHFHIYSRIIYRGEIRAGLIQFTVSGPHITMKVVVILSLKKKNLLLEKFCLFGLLHLCALFSITETCGDRPVAKH